MLTQQLKNRILRAQKEEMTEYAVYKNLALWVKNKAHADILQKIADEEMAHYNYFKAITNEDVQPDAMKAAYFSGMAKMFGLNFGLKLMEQAEHMAVDIYSSMKSLVPNIETIIKEEENMSKPCLNLLKRIV